MMKLLREIGPLAVMTVIAAVATLWLLGNNPSIGQWVLAAILFGHGWVHLMFVFPKPDPAKAKPGSPPWPFDLSTSWLITRAGAPDGPIVALGKVLMVLTFAASILAALATVGILVPAAWWPWLVLAAAGGSAELLILCFTPTLVIGLAIDAGLAWLALAGPWRPG